MPDWQAVNMNKEKAMKPRRLFLLIEMTTDAKVKDLVKDAHEFFGHECGDDVHQVQVNVAKPEKK